MMQVYDLALYKQHPVMIIAINPSGHCLLWPNHTGLPRSIPLADIEPLPDDRIAAIKRLFTRDLLERRSEVTNQLREIDRRLAALKAAQA